jgi:hypothetical protein
MPRMPGFASSIVRSIGFDASTCTAASAGTPMEWQRDAQCRHTGTTTTPVPAPSSRD